MLIIKFAGFSLVNASASPTRGWQLSKIGKLTILIFFRQLQFVRKIVNHWLRIQSFWVKLAIRNLRSLSYSNISCQMLEQLSPRAICILIKFYWYYWMECKLITIIHRQRTCKALKFLNFAINLYQLVKILHENYFKAAKIHEAFECRRTIPKNPISSRRTTLQLVSRLRSQRVNKEALHNPQRSDRRGNSRKKCQQSAKIITKSRCCCRATKNTNRLSEFSSIRTQQLTRDFN